MQPPPEDQLNATAENPLETRRSVQPALQDILALALPCPGKVHRRWFVQRCRVVYGSGVAADVELIEAVRAALRGAAQPELARPMQAYMKSATPLAIGY